MDRRRLTLLCGVTALWALSFGIGVQAVSHWLKHHDASDTLIGIVHSAYYLGVALAALAVPAITRHLGLRCSSLGMLLTAASLAAFPLAAHTPWWLALRLLSGAGCALSLVPLETLLSQTAGDKRTEHFSYYALALTIAGAVGIALGLDGFNADGLLLNVVGSPRNVFFVGALFPLVGSMVTHHGLAASHELDSNAAPRGVFAWRDHVLSFGTAWGQGFLEGGMLAFLSLHLVQQGYSSSSAGLLMGLTMAGLVAFQLPVGWLGDRLGATSVLLACYAVTAATLVLVPLGPSTVGLGLLLLTFGASSGAMYPLGLSLLGAKLPANDLARAYAWYLALECVGSQMGAAIMGWARDAWGGHAMFPVAVAALTLVLTTWAVTRRTFSAEIPSPSGQSRRAA